MLFCGVAVSLNNVNLTEREGVICVAYGFIKDLMSKESINIAVIFKGTLLLGFYSILLVCISFINHNAQNSFILSLLYFCTGKVRILCTDFYIAECLDWVVRP